MANVLDDAQVTELCELMGEDLVPLVQAFLRDSQERLQLLEQASLAAEWEQIRRQAHSLKGSSSNLGATALCAACLQLETQARTRDRADVTALVSAMAQVRYELDTVSAELKRRFLQSPTDLLC